MLKLQQEKSIRNKIDGIIFPSDEIDIQKLIGAYSSKIGKRRKP